jgi:outer membrane protein assembly factor BamB
MNRRRFLRFAGLASGSLAWGSLAGCLGTGRLDAPGMIDRPDLSEGPAWPTFGSDAANTGHDPDASGPTDDASIVWEFDAGSPTANTPPVVVGDAVYTGSSGTGGNLWALDAESGDRYWEFETDGWVNHAPAVADGTVFVGTDGQTVHAVDARSGDERWSVDLGRDLHDSSPTVVDGTVFVGTAGDSPATVSGDEDEDEVNRAGMVVALDADTGGTRWSFEVSDWISTTPAVAEGRVYFGDATGRVRALDASTGEEVWSFDAGSKVLSSPALTDGTLYFGANGRLYALDARTGDPHWTFDLRWPTVKSSPAVAGGTVFVGCHGGGGCRLVPDDETCDAPDETGSLHAVDADLGAEEWRYDVERDVRSSPAVADGIVYLGCAGGASAVRAADGREAWRVEFGSYVDSSPAVADGRVFVNCSDGKVYALGDSQ